MHPSRRVVCLVMVMTLALFAPPMRSIRAQEASPEATPAPRFTNTVEIDGRRIGLTCVGSGSPTVVLIGGLGSPGEAVWPPIVDAVSPLTRVCVFDRAGMGPSDPAPTLPQSAADVVTDLTAALQAAGETGPYVPVGFSLGGPFARLYASTHLNEVAGLVLVEGQPPDLNVRDLASGWFASEAERESYREIVAGRDPSLPGPVDQLLSGAQVLAAPLPQVPTLMIVAGMIDPAYPLVPNALWYESQAWQARDLGARIVIAEQSGHLVPFDQPEVVIAAIEEVVKAVREPSSWATPPAGTPAP